MSPELDALLRERHPLIFVGTPENGSLTPFGQHGFQCGDGWFDLIDGLCENLQNATKQGGRQVVASQVKEKYGALRFYTNGHNDTQGGMIDLTETLSERLCEVCGNRGKKTSNGGIRTRCPEHKNART